VRVVLASSSPEDELDHYLELLGAREIADAWTTKDDVETTKPAPDLVRAGPGRGRSSAGADDRRHPLGHRGRREDGCRDRVCVITGRWSRQELLDAGAVAVFESVDELRQRLDETPLGS
jgi:hypothetical protein